MCSILDSFPSSKSIIFSLLIGPAPVTLRCNYVTPEPSAMPTGERKKRRPDL